MQNLQENISDTVSFLIKLQAWGLEPFQERDPGLGVLLWFFRNLKHIFTEQFEKIHRSTFQRTENISVVFLRRIWRSEKNIGRSTAYLWRTNLFIKFQHLMKKNTHSRRLNNWSKTFLNQWELWVFVNQETEHLRATASEPLTNFQKSFIVDVRLGSKYQFVSFNPWKIQ